jgi:hypothetical protein
MRAALADLLDHSAPVLRSALGANPHVAAGTAPDAADIVAPAAVGGWVAFSSSARLLDEP